MKPIIISLLIILASCNSDKASRGEIQDDHALDTLIEKTDSSITDLMALDTLTYDAFNSIEKTVSEIKELREDKKELTRQLAEKYPTFSAIRSDDESLKKINELNAKLVQKEFENNQLRRKIKYDSLAKLRPSIGQKLQKFIEHDPVFPDKKSLIVNLDGASSDLGITVWAIPYSKKAKKELMGYDLFCNESSSKFGKYKARSAIYYDGKYLFNNLSRGKYIIKVCAFYGNSIIVEKNTDLMAVNLRVQ